jgi:hypothetical protein
MSELERRLRDAVQAESAAYEPAADLPGRIERRVRVRRRRTQALLGGGALAVAALVALVATQLPGDDDQGVVANDPSTTTTGSTSSTTPSTTETTSTTTTTVTTAPPPPRIDGGTPLNPKGLGPIVAGMTVAQAEAASGLTLTADGSLEDFGGYCYYVDLEGQPDLAVRVHSPDEQPVSDPRDGVISAITIFDQDPDGTSPRRTTAGVGLGATEAEVLAAHPGAVEERPHEYVPEGAYLYVLPADTPGFGIRYVLDEHRVVTSIDVGDADGITASEGCA